DLASAGIYALSLHDALPISVPPRQVVCPVVAVGPFPALRALHLLGGVDGGTPRSLRQMPERFGAAVQAGIAPADLCPLAGSAGRSEEHTSELQSRENLVCRL